MGRRVRVCACLCVSACAASNLIAVLITCWGAMNISDAPKSGLKVNEYADVNDDICVISVIHLSRWVCFLSINELCFHSRSGSPCSTEERVTIERFGFIRKLPGRMTHRKLISFQPQIKNKNTLFLLVVISPPHWNYVKSHLLQRKTSL